MANIFINDPNSALMFSPQLMHQQHMWRTESLICSVSLIFLVVYLFMCYLCIIFFIVEQEFLLQGYLLRRSTARKEKIQTPDVVNSQTGLSHEKSAVFDS